MCYEYKQYRGSESYYGHEYNRECNWNKIRTGIGQYKEHMNDLEVAGVDGR